MKTLLLTLLAATALAALQAASAQTEDQALAALKSSAPVAEKEAACLRLKGIGTARSVTTLRALVTDENLTQWAVDALQAIPVPEAGEALLQALPETAGKTRALVAFALGVRREAAAVKPLAELVLDADLIVAVAAAKALGTIDIAPSQAALWAVKPKTRGPVRVAVDDALLACANEVFATGDTAGAVRIYTSLRSSGEPEPVRTAAFRGLVFCAWGGDGSWDQREAALLVEALTAAGGGEQAMAIQLTRELPDAGLAARVAADAGKMSPLVQVALLEALRQRGDPSAATAVTVLTRAGEASVRLAALRALGELGDASHVGWLAQLATSGSPAERSEARQALISLHRGKVLEAILAEISKANTETQVELVQTLARRMDRGAVPDLLRLAIGSDAKLGLVATQALEKLADESQMLALLDLMTRAKDEARRDAAVSTYATVGGRSRRPAEFSRLALNALGNASVETRCALLEAAGLVGGPGVVEAMRQALKDANAEVHAAALRVLAENAGDEARPDLLKLAQDSATESDRELALRGYWRLVEAMVTGSQGERFAAVQAGLRVTSTPADKKLGLARLGELQSGEALKVALRYRDDAAIRAEAEAACLAIAARLEGGDLNAAEQALDSLASSAGSERVRTEARTALAMLDARKGYLAPWLVSGPYRQEGKEAQQLFDVAFAPESPAAGKAEWRPLAGVAGPTLDLLPVAGGNHCVVYLKTQVFCPKDQPVALEIGTDDGVKLWINGGLVHANNAVRGFTPGEDKAKASLKEGWNDLVLKVTQHTAGCAASVRVRTADGKAVSGLRVEAKK